MQQSLENSVAQCVKIFQAVVVTQAWHRFSPAMCKTNIFRALLGLSKLIGNGLNVGLESSRTSKNAKCLKPRSQAAKEHDVVPAVRHAPTTSACQDQEQGELS